MASDALKKAVRLAYRRTHHQHVDQLAFRAILKQHITSCTEDGKIAVVRSGRDCDGCSYGIVEHITAPSVMAWLKYDDERTRYLDGPEACYIDRPSNQPEGYEELQCQWER